MSAAMQNFPILLPLLFACGWGIVVLMAEAFSSDRRFTGVAWLTIVGLVGTALVAGNTGVQTGTYAGAMALDSLALYFVYLLCGLGVLTVLISFEYLPAMGIVRGEYYSLMLFSVAGLMIMAAATDLIVLFLGLEIMSMAVYVMVGLRKNELRSNEAALKYCLMGAFASAILLYGIALLYFMTGSTVLGEIASALRPAASTPGGSWVVYLAIGLVLVGFGFKVAAAPFHLWAPDVYEGAPTPVTAFMATAVKAGAFAAVVRVVLAALSPMMAEMTAALWVGAALTMTVGNLVALRQTSIKRMLAYSSIAHTGYLLVAVTAGTPDAASSILFYLAAYGAMNMAAFGVLVALSRRGGGGEDISDLAGLGLAHPMLAAAMTVCMLSLTGFPPFGGFVGKIYLFAAALDAGFTGLVVVALLNSVVSAAYYLGVVRAMYFEEGGSGMQTPRPYALVGVSIATAATVLLGVAPAPVLGAARRALEIIVLGP